MEDRQVIEHFLATKSEEAFSALFKAVGVRVHRYLLLHDLDRATAEELTQNVLFKVYSRAGELRNSDAFYGWLFAIVRNEMISYWRTRKARIETVNLESLSEHHISNLVAEHDGASSLRLVEWLEALSSDDRDLVMLRFVEGLSYEELSIAFDIPLGTVKWRIFNARKKILQAMAAMSLCKEGTVIN